MEVKVSNPANHLSFKSKSLEDRYKKLYETGFSVNQCTHYNITETSVPKEPLNFEALKEGLYCGGKLNTQDRFNHVQNFGIQTDIDFRTDNEDHIGRAKEAELCQQNGINYVRYPIYNYDVPTHQLEEVKSIVDNAPKPVYFHCRQGDGRTGQIRNYLLYGAADY